MAQTRIAFVTGGGGGIGAAICRALAADGHRVAAADLDLGAAERVAREIDGSAVEIDVTDPASTEAALAHCEASLGPVDVLVNCAGWDEFRPFLDTDEAFARTVLAINLEGPIRITRQVLPGMVERGRGRLVNVASDAGRVGSSLESIYSAAKGGLIAFTKTIAREVARHGITANSVCPGPTDTALFNGMAAASEDGERMRSGLTRAIPLGRLGLPEDVAPAVAFLASEQAGFITGQTLSVSGGLTMC